MKKVNYYAIGGQYHYYCYGGAPRGCCPLW